MLSSDEPIALLIEKLDALPRPDRAAILKRLSPRQREQVARLRTGGAALAVDVHSPELARRIAELGSDQSPLTAVARDALTRALRAGGGLSARDTARAAPRGSSLAEVAGSMFRRRAGA
ncbi:hypothetical protein [Sphingomonas koreensis]|uniref:hypothetical protein n=1 Tax=Sphingomonas koreensis TaxID=93064 RepID=UPI0013DE934E|nr:hypothetical protein [Sphingomonas koreensis]